MHLADKVGRPLGDVLPGVPPQLLLGAEVPPPVGAVVDGDARAEAFPLESPSAAHHVDLGGVGHGP